MSIVYEEKHKNRGLGPGAGETVVVTEVETVYPIPGGSAILHAVAAVVMAYGYIGIHKLPLTRHIDEQVGGHFQFLTIQGLAISWVTMVISLLCDLFPSVKFFRRAKRAFLMISLPLNVVIATIYWSLLAFFPHLILQRSEIGVSEPSSSHHALIRLPLHIDMSLHLSPVFFIVADFFVLEAKYSYWEASRWAPVVTALFGCWYGSWVEVCAAANGHFPYPFLEVHFPLRVLIYVTVSAVGYAAFRFINSFHTIIPVPRFIRQAEALRQVELLYKDE